MSRTVAVTGATGFLGSHIALHLVDQGWNVVAVVRNPEKAAWLTEHGIALAVADLADPDAMAAAFTGADAVVNSAALATREKAAWEDFHAANSVGSDNLMSAVAATGVKRVVYVSTIGVYRTRLLRLQDESTPMIREDDRVGWARVVTNWRYALSKAIGERRAWELAEEGGIGLTVLRPGPIYGPRDHKLTTTYGKAMQRRVMVAPTFRIPHVHAGDVAVAVAGALANSASIGNAYNVTGASVSPWQVLRQWKEETGSGPFLVPIPVPAWVDFDDSAAERDLGFKSRSLASGIADVVAAVPR